LAQVLFRGFSRNNTFDTFVQLSTVAIRNA